MRALKEIFIDINDYNKSFITATESDNNSDVYKIIITEDGRRFDLTGKTVQMAYAISYTDKGDILNLNVTNPTEGEITLEITNELTRKDGDYTCQLLILGENEYRRHSKYYFNLSIRENLFNKISGEIIKSPNIGILQELVKKAEFLNVQLENKNNVAESLNTNLNENISVADPLNSSLSEKIPEAATKKTELESSINKAKEFIEGLDGSQNIPQLRLDVTELQNGLKSNQALEYSGSSITANDTLEGRTEGMRIGGRTLVNLKGNVKNRVSTWVDNDDKYTLNLESGHGQPSILYNLTHVLKENQKYTVIVNLVEYTSGILHFSFMNSDGNKLASTTELVAESKGLKKFVFTINNTVKAETLRLLPRNGINNIYSISKNILILEGDWTNKEIPDFFEGLKSFGEAEQEGDKYKISILSNGKNLFNHDELTGGEILTFNNKRCYKFADNATNFSLPINGVLGKQYTLSIKMYRETSEISKKLNVKLHYSDGTYDIYNLDSGVLYKRTTKIGKRLVKITGSYNFATNSYIDLECTQLEEGTIATQYEPCKYDKKDILIKEPLRENDVLYEDNRQVKIDRIKKQYTFIGDESSWELQSINSHNIANFKINIEQIQSGGFSICNMFAEQKDSPIATTKTEGYAIGGANNALYIRIASSKASTLEEFKTLLKQWETEGNPLTIVYQLATPTTEVVENCVDIDLDTYQEKTYFSILNSLPGTLEFKVPSNIGSVIQNMAKEVNEIWDVINNLLVPGLMDTKKTLALKTIKNNLK